VSIRPPMPDIFYGDQGPFGGIQYHRCPDCRKVYIMSKGAGDEDHFQPAEVVAALSLAGYVPPQVRCMPCIAAYEARV